MKEVTMDERRMAARINLVDEHVRAENNHELDGTMATLNETPLFKLFELESWPERIDVSPLWSAAD
jgi:hypothetical protein